jgi:hypothetical protein
MKLRTIGFVIFLAIGTALAQVPPLLPGMTNVNLGTGPNTGTGDTAVTAFRKVNTNTTILAGAVERSAVCELHCWSWRWHTSMKFLGH